MDLHLWLSLVAICVMGAMSPGPSLALVIRHTIVGGRLQGVVVSISHGFGVGLWALFTLTGLGLLIVRSELAFSLIQYAGAAFLAYLGIQALRSTGSSGHKLDDQDMENRDLVAAAREGLLVSMLNPKLAIFFLALFSQFVRPGAGVTEQAIMVATAAGIDMLWYVLVATALSTATLLEKLRANVIWLDRISGVILIMLAIRVLF